MRPFVGLFDKFRKHPREALKPGFTQGARCYCIGDIHGRADLLQQLHSLILQDAARFNGHKKAVYLGDYIDRGEDSRAVIQLLLENPLPGFETVYLRGNHEQAMLDFLNFPEKAAGWLNYGGFATLLSYGVQLQNPSVAGQLAHVADCLRDCVPAAHLAFLEQLQLMHQEGSYCFVHAGIRPGICLQKQHPDDLLWIRDEFIEHPGPHEFIVVHGHSISEQAELLPHRVGIDTGACYSGVLTCLVLEDGSQRLMQTGT